MASSSFLLFLPLLLATPCCLATATSSRPSRNLICPFEYLYHFGDGATDPGNSVLVQPWGPLLPAARLPFGRTYPGTPNGRWSDGLVDFDFAAFDFGFPEIVPYLSPRSNTSNAVIFSVARSPVMDQAFFSRRGLRIPPYVIPLEAQMEWFRAHLRAVCGSPRNCAPRLANSVVLLGDIEANDIGYALIQNRTIEEAMSYIGPITRAQIRATRELIQLGARIIVIPASAPLGCFPYILTAMPSSDPAAYDHLGCLISVNRLINAKNRYLNESINNLSREFTNVSIIYGPFDEGVLELLGETLNREAHAHIALRACCGIGGRYNYNQDRFCGSPGVPVCRDPEHHIFWDGIHFTQEFGARIEQLLIQPTLVALNCTQLPTPFS